MSKKKFDENAWYVNIIGGVAALVMAIMLSQESEERYEGYLNRTGRDLPSGKGGKLGLLVLKLIDMHGGKDLVISALIGGGILFFIWAYYKYRKRNK